MINKRTQEAAKALREGRISKDEYTLIQLREDNVDVLSLALKKEISEMSEQIYSNKLKEVDVNSIATHLINSGILTKLIKDTIDEYIG